VRNFRVMSELRAAGSPRRICPACILYGGWALLALT